MTPNFDPYRALGVRREATDAEVKAAHRRLAKRFHPDADGGDRDRFLHVQEAYKLLSDPLLRRDWDARHAPGPFRADRTTPAARAPRQRAPRRPARPAREPDPGTAGSASTGEGEQEPVERRPRSSRAYTWSAADVPWWEEGHSENRRPVGRKRGARPSTREQGAKPPPPPHAGQRGGPSGAGPSSAGPSGAGPEGPTAFDVYNRSSGAAWSMAARAYFRRGDQDLPRRGTFQYEGTQVLTGARARTHAEAQARRRAAEPARQEQGRTQAAAAGAPASAAAADTPRPGTFAYASAGISRDAQHIHDVRQAWRRRTNAASWPSLGERLLYALVAWVPAAILIGYGGAVATGCEAALPGCPSYLETVQAVSIALVLGALVALPKVAYVGAISTIGALMIGLVIVGIMALWGVPVPLSLEMTAALGVALAAGYVATAAFIVLRDRSTRPWHTAAR